MTDTHHWGYPPHPPTLHGWPLVSNFKVTWHCILPSACPKKLGVGCMSSRQQKFAATVGELTVRGRESLSIGCWAEPRGGSKIDHFFRTESNNQHKINSWIQFVCAVMVCAFFYVASFDHVGFMILDTTLNSCRWNHKEMHALFDHKHNEGMSRRNNLGSPFQSSMTNAAFLRWNLGSQWNWWFSHVKWGVALETSVIFFQWNGVVNSWFICFFFRGKTYSKIVHRLSRVAGAKSLCHNPKF